MAHPFERIALYETIKACRQVQRKNEEIGWDEDAVRSKIIEELGELNEALLIFVGKTRHKKLDSPDDILLEAADTMICMMDVLSRAYPDKAPDELYIALQAALDKKRARWIDGKHGVLQTHQRMLDSQEKAE